MDSRLRVGCLPYLNSEPFFAYLEGVERVSMMPRALGAVMARGELDAGLVSLADALAMGDALRRLPFGIATPGATGSVLFFTRKPLAALHGATIGITGETSTSVRLLRLLLEHRHGVKDVRWTTVPEATDATDAILVIGDEALRRRGRSSGFASCIDLGAEWHAWTGLPAVFAVWVVRRTVSDEARAKLQAAIDEALTRGLANLDAIAARRHGDTGISESEVVSYLTNFIYRFGPAELRAIEEFTRLLAS
jgi:chorismate dehydratase